LQCGCSPSDHSIREDHSHAKPILRRRNHKRLLPGEPRIVDESELCKRSYCTVMLSIGNPISVRRPLIFLRWSPWRIICPFFAVPPHAQEAFSCRAMRLRSSLFLSTPSMTVIALPHFLVSRRTVILCCCRLKSSQTQMSLGSPQTGQISAIIFQSFLDVGKDRYHTSLFKID